jgi:hypothetical protein
MWASSIADPRTLMTFARVSTPHPAKGLERFVTKMTPEQFLAAASKAFLAVGSEMMQGW